MNILAKISLPVLAFMAVIGVSAIAPTKASAALAGENGPILYVDNADKQPTLSDSIECISSCVLPENTVNTTNPDGSNTIVADANENPITSATISAQKPDTNYDIVYATETPNCETNPDILNSSDAVNGDYCNQVGSNAELNLVTIDSNRNPIGNTQVKTLDSLEKYGKELAYNRVYQTSYSPDGTQVLITRASSNDGDYDYRALELVGTQNFATSPVVTVLPTAKDKCLSGAFAQNGSIYFSSCPKDGSAGVFYYEAGADYTQPPKVLFEDKEIKPYLIDVSPDGSEVLVADISYVRRGPSCNYARTVLNFQFEQSAGVCNYYYGSADTVTAIPELSRDALGVDFVPRFFSPDGKFIIGTVFPDNCNKDSVALNTLLSESGVDETIPYTASFNRADGTLTALTNTIGVQEWAPIVPVSTTTTTPVSVTSASAPKLANTGFNSLVVALASLAIIFSTLLLSVKVKPSKV